MHDLFLLAEIEGQMIAIRSDQVESVVDIGAITPIPRTTPDVRGLAALRSRVVTVVDAAIVMGGGESRMGRQRAVVTRVDGHYYALQVDALDDVAEFQALPMASGLVLGPAWRAVATGMIEIDDCPVLIVDLSAIVARIGRQTRVAA